MSTDSANLTLAMSAAYELPVGKLRTAASKWKAMAAVYFESLCNPWTLLVCKLTIGLVSAYDIFLTVKYFETLPSLELNPIGRWLMMLDQGPLCEMHNIASFIAAKFAGNFIALCVIELLAAWRLRVSTVVALAVAGCQLLLFCYLQLAHLIR